MEKLADRCVKGARAGVGLALWDLHPCVLTSAARPAGSRLLLLLTPVFTSTRSDVDTPLALFPFSRACGAWEYLGNPSRCSDNARSLTRCATGELLQYSVITSKLLAVH